VTVTSKQKQNFPTCHSSLLHVDAAAPNWVQRSAVILHRVTWNGEKFHPREVMSSFRLLFVLLGALMLASCGEPERARPAAMNANAARAGTDFDEVGKVGLYPGESCASQIMFVFHGARSTSVSMAAPFRVSRILTDAARDRKTVHVWGKWRRGKAPGCSYVEATQADVQKSFW
jgi:hypothetical protein